jgi:transcriptional regulator
MYTPAAFVEDDPDRIAQFFVEHPMAQLVTMTDAGLVATPLPLLYEQAAEGFDSLVGHVARANQQWSESMPAVEALAIFTGPNAYVSPNWSPSKEQHGRVVPTWNYETVHVRGRFVVHDETDWKRALVTRLTQRHEAQFEKQWSVDDAPPDYIESMLKAIVGIEVQITSIEAKRKLSQNKPPADIAGIADGLARVGGASATIADAMRAL